MKKKLLLLPFLIFFVTMSALAQVKEPSNTQAKVYFKAYNSAIAKIKAMPATTSKSSMQQQLTTAESNIKSIKRVEPGYDVAPLESELEGFKAKFTELYVGKESAADEAALRDLISRYRANQPGQNAYQTIYAVDLRHDLKVFKTKYPTTDASKLEAEVNEAIAFRDGQEEAAVQGNEDRVEFEHAVIKLFKQGHQRNFLSGAGDLQAEIAALRKPTDDFTAQANAVLTGDLPARTQASAAKFESEILEGMRENAAKAIGEASKSKSYILDVAYNRSGYDGYFKAIYMQNYWGIAKKAFPAETAFAQAESAYGNVVSSIGSQDNLAKIIEKNRLAHLQTVRMEPAAVQDAGMAAEFKAVFNARGTNESVQKVNLIDAEWTVHKDPITKQILHRSRAACIATKTQEGKCMVYRILIHQDHTGGAYGPSIYNGHTGEEILCQHCQ